MGQRQLVEFKCDAANCSTTFTVDVVEQGDIPSGWPDGWLIIKMRAVGHSLATTKVFCPLHREPPIVAMGYESYKNYDFVVKERAITDRVRFEKIVKPGIAETFGLSLSEEPEDEPN
jgi:hypothetical protein